MKLLNIVGARPNFIKIAPIIHELNKRQGIEHKLVHTGQHYDIKMSQQFFDELNIPMPDISLNVGSGTHAVQVAKIMTAFDEVCEEEKPDAILVVGDVNSTMATSLVASKRGIKIIHVEAGIRSFDRGMPEEINRLVTDAITDLFLPPSSDAVDNLLHEGVPEEKIVMVGNIMIDTLVNFQDQIQESDILERLNLKAQEYVVMTIHRPSNVDDPTNLEQLVISMEQLAKQLPIVLPIHVRTKKKLEEFGLWDRIQQVKGLTLLEPLGYFDFGKLVSSSKLVLTDSGGIQEETTVYKIPCITLRPNTERPITVTLGSNKLVATKADLILSEVNEILKGSWKSSEVPPLWDGKTAGRIVDILEERYA